MNDNIKRARVIEFTDSGGQECLVKRDHASDLLFTGIQSSDSETKLGSYRLGNIQKYCTNIRVLDTFPVTLADLIPEGCEAFRFKRRYNVEITATKGAGEQADVWTINGMHGLWRDLNKLSDDLGVCLDTVVPLELRVHPQYMEERR